MPKVVSRSVVSASNDGSATAQPHTHMPNPDVRTHSRRHRLRGREPPGLLCAPLCVSPTWAEPSQTASAASLSCVRACGIVCRRAERRACGSS
jgi:hypothetical protein